MKKNWLGMIIVIFTTAVVFYQPVTNIIWPEKPVTKEISFAIGSEKNYKSSVYENSSASVHVIITKVRGNNRSIVWEKNFDTLQLRKYPELSKAYKQQVTVPGIYESKENLLITYVVTYNSKGSILQIANGTLLPAGVKKDGLLINI